MSRKKRKQPGVSGAPEQQQQAGQPAAEAEAGSAAGTAADTEVRPPAAPAAGGNPHAPDKPGASGIFGAPAGSAQADRSAAIEDILPTDYFRPDAPAGKRRRRRFFLLAAVAALLLALIAAAAVYWSRLNNDPSAFFSARPSATPAPPAVESTPAIQASPTPSPDPYAVLEQQADLSMMQDIVNILLIGVDYAEERESWGGKNGLSAAHADVMIVLAVNFDENTADLISLPRDTYTKIPGVSGIYKLNASLDCGGGLLAENGAGFEKVCETASYLLGGIPVDHYYAVTMPAVKELVDAIGGVDYRLDISFTMQGRTYTAGRRHMNGQAVLDYLRVRKESSGLEPGQQGDAQRVKRQKKMLLAIFEQLKKKNMLLKVPDILSAFEGQLFTNCSASQTAALALYAYNMPGENIGMHSMSGKMRSLYSWNFSFIDQDNRLKLIREIYGVDVPVIREITESYALNVYQTKIANQYINTCGPLTKYVAALLAEDDLRPEFTATPAPTPEATPAPTPAPTAEPAPEATPTPGQTAPTPTAEPAPEATDSGETIPAAAALTEETRRYSEAQRNIYKKYLEALDRCKSLRGGSSKSDASALSSACNALKSAATRCASTFGYTGKLTWTIPPLANTNEIYVDFR